jgi:PKD repeat protein
MSRKSIRVAKTTKATVRDLTFNTIEGRFASSLRKKIVLAAVGCIGAALIVWSAIGSAATPSSGTLTTSTTTLTYTGGPFAVANPSAQANGTPVCNAALPCDDFTLTISVPAGTDTTKRVRVNVAWPVAAADFDVYVLQGATVVATAASSSDPEVLFLPAVSAMYTIRTVPFAPAGQSYTGTITLEDIPASPPPASGIAPRYQNYPPKPTDLAGADSAGEPSIGIDWDIKCAASTPGCENLHPNGQFPKRNTGGCAFFTANLNEYRVTFDDCSSPAKHLWEDKTSPQTSATSLDPIGFVDHQTGRVFQSQLAGASSVMAFSDDDGQTWTASQGSGQPAGVDHQTVGGGPYNNASTPPPPPHPLYANQTYYASQDVGTAFAARSDNGGLTFGPGVPMWNLTQCGGLHGHVKVAADGTVYVPNKGCGGGQGVAVSTDNGLTWTVRTVPGSTPGDTDPSVGLGSETTTSTLYLGYANGDGKPHMAASTDRGLTWTDREVGQGFIKNTVFPQATAGDGDRAAFGFLGTTTAGNYQDTNNFRGVWNFYIATTFDHGNTYTLVNATGNDPVQIGSICTGGTTCGGDRNLLDFNDLQVDKEGRVLAAYADGCVAPACTLATASGNPPYNTSRSALSSIIRQSGGRRLFVAYDPIEPAVPAAPRVDSVTQDGDGVAHLSWSEPDNSGSALTGYNVYRKDGTGGSYALLATVTLGCPACKTTYDDPTAATPPTSQYFYKVTALNLIGEGTNCGDFPIGVGPTDGSPCVLPGVGILTDPSGDLVVPIGVTSNAGWDVRSLRIAEPLAFNPNKVVFTLKMESLATVPPNTRWPVTFNAPNAINYTVRMTNVVTDGATTAPIFQVGPTAGPFVAADPASNFNADGTITMVVPTSAIGSPTPGQTISGFLTRIAATVPVAGTITPDNMPDSLAPSGAYTLVGNLSCDTKPTAVLTANPTSGTAPLLVNFSGAGSNDTDPGDSVVSYTFDFGDGSAPVTQAGPTISHTYTTGGNFQARLTVTDTYGVSSSPALANIDVDAAGGVTNYALTSNGGVATASTTFIGLRSYPPEAAINGDRTGGNWENGTGGWNDNTRGIWEDWLQVAFSGQPKIISEIRVFTLQNNFRTPTEPDANTPADVNGILDFDVQYWNGSAWVTVTGGTVTGNTKAMRVFTFTPVTTTAVRVLVHNGRVYYSRIVELEAYGAPGQP